MEDKWKNTQHQPHLPFLVVPNVFSISECQQIIAFMQQETHQEATTWNGEEFIVDRAIRSSQTVYVSRNNQTMDWVYRRMDLVFTKTAKIWGFDVRETLEDLKYIHYREQDHFKQWHMDLGENHASLRKLSLSIELNSTSEFDGGDLEIFPASQQQIFNEYPRKPGTAVVFPSFRYHRVSPVTQGERHVLINWISGPALK